MLEGGQRSTVRTTSPVNDKQSEGRQQEEVRKCDKNQNSVNFCLKIAGEGFQPKSEIRGDFAKTQELLRYHPEKRSDKQHALGLETS